MLRDYLPYLIPKGSTTDIVGETRSNKIADAQIRSQLASVADQRKRTKMAQNAQLQELVMRKQKDTLNRRTMAEDAAFESWVGWSEEKDPIKRQDYAISTAKTLQQKYGADAVPDTLIRSLSTPKGLQSFENAMSGRYRLSTANQKGNRETFRVNPGESRYFKDPKSGEEYEAHQNVYDGDFYYRGQRIPKHFDDITQQKSRAKGVRKANLEISKKEREAWIDDRGEFRKSAQEKTAAALEDISLIDSAIESLDGVATGPGGSAVAMVDNLKRFAGIQLSPTSPANAKQFIAAYQNRIISKYFADQKGSINKKEFEQILAAAPDINKTPIGNMLVLELEREIADWRLNRNTKIRSLLNSPSIRDAASYDKALAEWDRQNSQQIISKDLKKRVESEQKNAAKLDWTDIFATGDVTQSDSFDLKDFNADLYRNTGTILDEIP